VSDPVDLHVIHLDRDDPDWMKPQGLSSIYKIRSLGALLRRLGVSDGEPWQQQQAVATYLRDGNPVSERVRRQIKGRYGF
jgi:hypothetical protein